MALDKNKLVAEATRHVQKAQWDKAIRVYERILAEDPRDVRVLLKIGELQQKKGDAASAAETLHRVAQAYTDQGFFLKAVAVYKQIVRLTPGEARLHEKLAGLYQQLGIVSDAMAQLQLVAQVAEAAGDEKRLFEVLGRMVELDPENPGAAVKLGELHAKNGAVPAALEQLRRAADVLKRANRADEHLRVLERIAALDDKDASPNRELAKLYLARGDTKRALAKLQVVFKTDPTDVGTLGLLAAAFRDLGQLSKTASVYKELAHVEAERGRDAEARAAWQRVLEVAPEDADALAALGDDARRPVAAEPAVAEPAVEAAVAAPSPRAPVRPPAEALPKLLQETEVFAKYGLHKKALEHLEKIFAADPDHLEGRERARDLCAASGDAAAAAEHGARAVQAAIAQGDLDRAGAALGRLGTVAPGDARLATLEAALRSARGASPVELGADEIVLHLEPEEPRPALDDVTFGAAPAEVVEEAAPALDDVSIAPAEVVDEAAPALDDVSIAPAEALDEVSIAPADALDEVSFEPATVDDVAISPVGGGVEAGAAETGVVPEPDLQAETDEIDFFVQQGLVEEAAEVLAHLLAVYPTHSQLLARQEKLRAGRPGGEGVDLGRELSAELGEPVAPLDLHYKVQDVFDRFEKGVGQAVTAEDGETHYDLGMAYKEMGLLDEAVREFEIALTGRRPRDAAGCLTMIGICKLLAGDAPGAVEAYRRALAGERVPPDATRALHYELARAYEALGDRDGALWYLQKVLRSDQRYRDARERVARLGGGAGRPPAGDPDASEPPRRAAAKKIGFV